MASDPLEGSDQNRGGDRPPPLPRSATVEPSSPKGQQGTRRFVYGAWPDQLERDLCEFALVAAPERAPFSGRTGIAVPRWVVVDRRDERILICNRVHEGSCAWPWDVHGA